MQPGFTPAPCNMFVFLPTSVVGMPGTTANTVDARGALVEPLPGELYNVQRSTLRLRCLERGNPVIRLATLYLPLFSDDRSEKPGYL